VSRHAAIILSDSSARGLRTVYQSAVGLIGLVPTIIGIFAVIPADTPGYGKIMVIMANVIIWTGIASKLINALEDKGIIPAPWKVPGDRVEVSEEEVKHDN
jgi:hypothetical protein